MHHVRLLKLNYNFVIYISGLETHQIVRQVDFWASRVLLSLPGITTMFQHAQLSTWGLDIEHRSSHWHGNPMNTLLSSKTKIPFLSQSCWGLPRCQAHMRIRFAFTNLAPVFYIWRNQCTGRLSSMLRSPHPAQQSRDEESSVPEGCPAGHQARRCPQHCALTPPASTFSVRKS